MVKASTDCPMCARAEMSGAQAAALVMMGLLFPRSIGAGLIMQGQGSLWSAALGIHPPTWYDRHRDNWERTGNVLELHRMTRHVSSGAVGE